MNYFLNKNIRRVKFINMMNINLKLNKNKEVNRGTHLTVTKDAH